MKHWKRSLFFWILVVTFFITAPAVILRARGYRFDFNRGVFIYSGSITIKSNPQDIEVALDGKINESKKIDRINNSSQISGFLPGEYNLEVKAPGFRTWNKKVQIRSGLSTEFWNVLLVRENYQKNPYILEKSDRFFISPKSDQLASVRHQENELKIDILNIEKNQIINTFSFENSKLVSKNEQENIEWSPEKSLYISIPVNKNPDSKSQSKDYLIVNTQTKNFFSLEEFLDISPIKNVRFHSQKEKYIFFLSENKLYRANLEDSNDIFLISEDISAFNLSESYLYFSQNSNHITYRKYLENLEDTQQITNHLPQNFNDKIKKIIIYDKNRIAFLNENKDLYIFNKGEKDNYFKKLASNAEGLHFSNDGKKLLFWTQNEISIYFLRDWEVQPERQENELKNITRYIDSIENVQWFSDYEHVIFNTGPYVKIIELDSRNKRNSMDILTLNNTNHFLNFDALLEKMFLIDENDKLYSIDFPEPTGILGF